MNLFASWFSASVQNALQKGQKTFSLAKESRALDGVKPVTIEEFLKLKPLGEKRNKFFQESEKTDSYTPGEEQFNKVLESFKNSLTQIKTLSDKGINTCKEALSSGKDKAPYIQLLNQTDSAILSSSVKEAAALVFPSGKRLQELSSFLKPDSYGFEQSKLVYSLISDSASSILKEIKKCL